MTDSIPPAPSYALGQHALRAVGALLLVVLAIWVVATLAGEPLVAQLPRVPGLGRGEELTTGLTLKGRMRGRGDPETKPLDE